MDITASQFITLFVWTAWSDQILVLLVEMCAGPRVSGISRVELNVSACVHVGETSIVTVAATVTTAEVEEWKWLNEM